MGKLKYHIKNKNSKKSLREVRNKPLPPTMMTWVDKYSNPEKWADKCDYQISKELPTKKLKE